MRVIRGIGVGLAWLAASIGTSVAFYALPTLVWNLALLLVGRDVGGQVLVLLCASTVGLVISVPVYRMVWPDVLDGTRWGRRR